MDANLRAGLLCLVLTCVSQAAIAAPLSQARTPNFVVSAPTSQIADSVARCAETWRKDLAVLWLGQELPNWNQPCPISVKVGQIGAGGSTTFTFDQGEVFGWNMKVQGTLERILDSVIPHEVNHTIFATHFRRPLPRWADEGAATLVEHESERSRQTELLNQVIRTRRRIPLINLLEIREYPSDMQQVLTLYAEGYSLADYLVRQKGEQGRSVFLQFLEDAHRQGWEKAFAKHYDLTDLRNLEKQWTDWVIAGSPELPVNVGEQLADAAPFNPLTDAVVRSQSPETNSPASVTPPPLPMIGRELRTVSRSAQLPEVAQDALHRESGMTRSQTMEARGDAGESRLRSNPPEANARALSRNSLTPTADGISSHADGMSYRFPKVRAF